MSYLGSSQPQFGIGSYDHNIQLSFVSITFPLNGGLVEKLSLLIAGNFIGLLCNLILSSLAKTTTGHLYDSFRAIYLILSPLANVIWIVSYWSMSLTILSRRSKKKQRGG